MPTLTLKPGLEKANTTGFSLHNPKQRVASDRNFKLVQTKVAWAALLYTLLSLLKAYIYLRQWGV
jgi:hypothetical protein